MKIDWSKWEWGDEVQSPKEYIDAIRYDAANLVVEQIMESLREDGEVSLDCLDGETVKFAVQLLPNTDTYVFFDIEELDINFPGDFTTLECIDTMISVFKRMIDKCEAMKSGAD